MTSPCDRLSGAIEQLGREFRCTPSADVGTAIVSTGRYYSDGDAVDVYVRFSPDGERVVVSDGGLTRGRLELADSEDLGRSARQLWSDVIADFGVTEFQDRVFVRGPSEQAAQLVSQLADATLSLDTVKLFTEQERVTFAQRLERWLRVDANLNVTAERTVEDRYGDAQQVTAVVESGRRRIAVLAAGGNSASAIRTNAYRSHWVFSGLDPSEWPDSNRLVVLESSGRDRGTFSQVIARLSEVAYVGSFQSQLAIRDFLVDPAPIAQRDLVTLPYRQGRFS